MHKSNKMAHHKHLPAHNELWSIWCKNHNIEKNVNVEII